MCRIGRCFAASSSYHGDAGRTKYGGEGGTLDHGQYLTPRMTHIALGFQLCSVDSRTNPHIRMQECREENTGRDETMMLSGDRHSDWIHSGS